MIPHENKTAFAQLDPPRYPLIRKFYKQHGYSAKTNRKDKVFAAYAGNALAACLRIAPLEAHWLLRAVVVAPEHRGKGIARELISYSVGHSSINQIWTFPFSGLVTLYKQAGFEEQEIELAPLEIKNAFAQYLHQGRRICSMVWRAPVQERRNHEKHRS